MQRQDLPCTCLAQYEPESIIIVIIIAIIAIVTQEVDSDTVEMVVRSAGVLARMKAHQKAQLVRLLSKGLQVSDNCYLKVICCRLLSHCSRPPSSLPSASAFPSASSSTFQQGPAGP